MPWFYTTKEETSESPIGKCRYPIPVFHEASDKEELIRRLWPGMTVLDRQCLPWWAVRGPFPDKEAAEKHFNSPKGDG